MCEKNAEIALKLGIPPVSYHFLLPKVEFRQRWPMLVYVSICGK